MCQWTEGRDRKQRCGTKLDHGVLAVGYGNDDSTDNRKEETLSNLSGVPSTDGSWSGRIRPARRRRRRSIELEASFAKDRTLPDPSRITNPEFRRVSTTHEFRVKDRITDSINQLQTQSALQSTSIQRRPDNSNEEECGNSHINHALHKSTRLPHTDATRHNSTHARMSWRSDCTVILDSAAHVWVPAGHPLYTHAHFGGEAVVAHCKSATPCTSTQICLLVISFDFSFD